MAKEEQAARGTESAEAPVDDFPSFDLVGKKALVTGATKGMGRHVAVALAHAGADVFLSGRDEGELAGCAEEVRAQGRRAETMVAELADVDEVDGWGKRPSRPWAAWTYSSTTPGLPCWGPSSRSRSRMGTRNST